MTVSSGFFNSVNHDRLYDAEQVSSIFDGIIEDGVYESIGEAFMVKPYADGNDTVIVGTGRAWFDHTWTLSDAQFSITLSPPNTLLGRIDTIVIDVDRRDNVRANSIKCIEGDYGTEPTAPTLLNEELHKQYPIADIKVNPGVSGVISAYNITYRVGTEACPLVTGPLEALNITNYFKQMESEFDIWFEGVKDILDENVAMDLQNQINELRHNQTVSEDGEIGGYIIPFTKEVMEVIKDGGKKLKVNTIQFNNSAFIPMDPDSTDNDDIADMGGYCEPGPYNQSFILPDGKVCRVIRVPFDNTVNYGATKTSKVYVAVEIITPEGVVNTTQSQVLDFSQYLTYVRAADFHPYISYIDADSYPVHAVVYGEIDGSGIGSDDEKCYLGAYAYYVTITSEGVVSFTSSVGAVQLVSPIGEWESSTRTLAPAFLDNDSAVGLLVTKNYPHGGRPLSYLAYKVAKDGVVTVSPAYIGQTGSGVPSWPQNQLSRTAVKMYYDRTSGLVKARLICTQYNVSSYIDAKYFEINPSNMTVTMKDGNLTVPSDYPFICEGSIDYITSNTVYTKTWNRSFTPSVSSGSAFNPIVFYDSGVSLVDYASVLAKFEEGLTEIYLLVNSGANTRSVFSGKNGISVYGSKTPTTLANSTYLTSDKCVRNKYRIRTINGVLYMLFDSVERYSKAMNESDYSDTLARTKLPDGVYLLTISYETEE